MIRKVMFLIVILSFLVGCTAQTTPVSTDVPATAAPTVAATEPPSVETSETEPETTEPIYFGLTGPFTGGGASQGEYAEIGAQKAVEELNAAGGINGRMVELVIYDDKGDPQEAALVAQRYVDDPRIEAVIGPLWSSAAMAAMPIYEEAGMPVLTPTASADEVTQQGWEQLIRVGLRNAIQAPLRAAFLVNNLGRTKIAIFYDNSANGRSAMEDVRAVVEQLGAEIVDEEPVNTGVDTDFAVQLTRAEKAGADGIFITAQYNEGSLIVSQAAQLGLMIDQKIVVVSSGALLQDLVRERVGADAEDGFYIVVPDDFFSDRPVVKELRDYFEEVVGTAPNQTGAYSYDALHVIATAMEAGATRETLVETIKSMTFTDLIIGAEVRWGPEGDREDVKSAVVQVKDHEFVSGGTEVDATGLVFEMETAETEPETTEPIYFGLTGPFTGGGASQGEYAEIGAKKAVEELNAAGGINGRMVELVIYDDKGDPQEAALVAQRYVDDPRIVAVIGPLWSSAAMAAMPIYEEAGMPVLTPTASADEVTQQGWEQLIRVGLRNAIQAPLRAAFLVNNLGRTKIAIFYDNSANGRSAMEDVRAVVEQLGAEIVDEEPVNTGVDTDFTVQLTRAEKAGADGIFITAQYNEGSLIVSQAAQLGLMIDQKIVVVSSGALLQDLVRERVGADAEDGFYIVVPDDFFSDRPVVKELRDYFEEVVGTAPNQTGAYSYDALHVIATAMEAGATRETLVETIKSMTFTDLIIGAEVQWGPEGDREDVKSAVVQVKDHEFVAVGWRSTPPA